MFLLPGIVIGSIITVIRGETSPDLYSLRISDGLYQTMDSLAEAERKANTGVDSTGNAIQELAAADSTGNREQPFPFSKKKEAPAGKVNLNTATKAELMKLPGVGEKTAENIIEYRAAQRFRSPVDIMNIKGIGQKKYEKMAQYISVR